MQPRVTPLLIGSDQRVSDKINRILSNLRTQDGWDIDRIEAMESLLQNIEGSLGSYNLIIIYPDFQGPNLQQLLRDIREHHHDRPGVIVIGLEDEITEGDFAAQHLNAGADDVVPFTIDRIELRARIHALIRRAGWPSSAQEG